MSWQLRAYSFYRQDAALSSGGVQRHSSLAVVERIEGQGAEAVIPSQNNKEQRVYDRERYKDGNVAERFWRRLKEYRRVATR